MTDGTYIGVQPVKPLPDDLRSSQEHALALWPEVDRFVSALGALDRVYLVGAGGSLSGLNAAHYRLEKEGRVPVASLNSDEFFHRSSPAVGPGALVIVLSAAGTTPETARAARWAVERGAAVAGVTLNPDGALAHSVGRAFVARTGDGNQILLQLLGLAVLRREGVDVRDHLAALRALPAAAEATIREFEPVAERIAGAMKDVPVTYLIASGSLQGMGATFTSCFLQEMQWMHAATINADEFFQGPFEVFDGETKSILFLGEDETRPMAERVDAFLTRYGGDTFRIDSRDLSLPGIAADQRAFVAPLIYYPLIFRLAAHYAAARGYALEGRRYMWQFDY